MLLNIKGGRDILYQHTEEDKGKSTRQGLIPMPCLRVSTKWIDLEEEGKLTELPVTEKAAFSLRPIIQTTCNTNKRSHNTNNRPSWVWSRATDFLERAAVRLQENYGRAFMSDKWELVMSWRHCTAFQVPLLPMDMTSGIAISDPARLQTWAESWNQEDKSSTALFPMTHSVVSFIMRIKGHLILMK